MAQFTPIALDNLINEVAGATEELHDELVEYEDNSVVANPAITNLVDQHSGMSVDFKRTYAQLEKLLENGNEAMTLIKAIDPDVTNVDTIHAITALINSLRAVTAEFNKIHLQTIKYNHTLNLLEVKHQHKLKEIEAKNAITSEKPIDAQVVPEWDSTQMQEFMEWKRSKMMNDTEKLNA